METPSLDQLRFGPFEVRPATRELFKHGMRVKLPPQAFEVLRVLLERRGELVTRQEFHGILWSADTFVDFDQGLNNAIKRIREVLNDSPESPRYIETLPRLGYRFIGEVETVAKQDGLAESSAHPYAPTLSALVESSPDLETGQATPAPARRRKPAYLLVSAAVLGILAILWLLRPNYPRPRITSAVQLTADGIPKWGPIATDGLRVYFTEVLNGHETIAAVPVTGGQAVPLKLPFLNAGLYDISPDKADLLVAETPDMFQDAPLWRVPVIGGTPRRLGNLAAHDALWSPDGKKLAYAIRGGVFLANADGSAPRTLVASRNIPNEWAWRPKFSSDGSRLRFNYYDMERSGAQIWEVNADGSSPHPVFDGTADPPMKAFGNWTSGSKYYVFSGWKELESSVPPLAANLWAVREKEDLFHRNSASPEELTTGPTRYFANALSLDGKTIFALSSHKHGELMRYDARTKSFVLYASGLSAEGVAFSPDGKYVAYVKYPQGELWRGRIDGSDPLQLSSRPLFAADPRWSADSKQITFTGALAGQPSHSFVVPADGGAPRIFDQIGPTDSDPSWASDGRTLVFLDHKNGIKIRDLQAGTITEVPESAGLFSPRVSPDGRWIIALASNLQKLLLFDIPSKTWRELAHGNTFVWPQWSRDSAFIYFSYYSPGAQVFRIRVNGGKLEQIVDLKEFLTVGVINGWFSLTPNGDVLALHDTGGATEIYALSWDAP